MERNCIEAHPECFDGHAARKITRVIVLVAWAEFWWKCTCPLLVYDEVPIVAS